MGKYRCVVCGYVYDPEEGDPEGNIPPRTPFEELPEDWVCPVCGADKSMFKPV
ncbi:MAG: rubredoxin [Dictyoglomus turgidum]|nr:MAG: rubredoxin [Dictyoglomus turgidum]